MSAPSDSGWVIGFDLEDGHDLLWVPPVDRDYCRGRDIPINQKRAIVWRAARGRFGIVFELVPGFEMKVDEAKGI
jgi:hypothetical protein